MALPQLASLTGGGALHGGSAGPSSAGQTATNTNNFGFSGGSVNFGSNNGIPTWAVALLAAGAVYVYFKKR